MEKVRLPEIGERVTTEWAIELCQYFGLDYLVERVNANPGAYKTWVFDGCSMLPDVIVSRFINVPELTIICLKHDLKYGYGECGNDEERLKADFELGLDLLDGGAIAEVSLAFFTGVQVGGGGELGFNFSWGFAHKQESEEIKQ